MKTLLPFFLIVITLLAGCNKDDDPSGAAAAVNKTFNLVMPGLESTVAYKIAVSPDGTKVLIGINNETNPEYYYSTDGGANFTAVSEVMQRRFRYLDQVNNAGVTLTTQKEVFKADGTQVSISGGEFVILGDNDKVFVYSHNSATLSYKTVNDAAFQVITKPVTATPGSAANYYAIKAQGKGVAFIVSPINRSDKTISAYVLDEATMTWNSFSVPLIYNNINNCNSLLHSEKFFSGSNNTLIMKGCSGMAIMDLAKGTAKYIAYPTTPTSPDVKLDGNILTDNVGNMFMMAASVADPGYRIYQYKTDKWEGVFDNLATTSAIALDNAGNIYYNSVKSENTVMKAPVKLNTQSSSRTLLTLPRTKDQINDAVVIGNEVMIVSNSQLFRYDIKGSTLRKVDLPSVTHFTVLSDGRWVAGGTDVINISSDDGGTWTKTDKIFSSVNAKSAGLSVVAVRVVNGQMLVSGMSTYFYNNLSLGIQQTKHDNLVVALTGSAPAYQFPADFSPSCFGPDGVLYGTALFVSEFGSVMDLYAIKPGVFPDRLPIKQGPVPLLVADDGLQMTVKFASDRSGYEIFTRKSMEEEWAGSNNKIPTSDSFQDIRLRAAGETLTFMFGSEVYAAGN